MSFATGLPYFVISTIENSLRGNKYVVVLYYKCSNI